MNSSAPLRAGRSGRLILKHLWVCFSASARRDDELVRININKCIELPIILSLLQLAKKRPILEKHVGRKCLFYLVFIIALQ